MIYVCNSCGKTFVVEGENVQCISCESDNVRRGNDREVINFVGSSLLMTDDKFDDELEVHLMQ